jgi:hypothetical protein
MLPKRKLEVESYKYIEARKQEAIDVLKAKIINYLHEPARERPSSLALSKPF